MGHDISKFNEKAQAQIRGQLTKRPQENELPPAIEIRTNLVHRPTTDEMGLNKTERAFYGHLQLLNYFAIGVQSITLKLANDCRLTMDFWAIGFNGELIMWDVKGFQREDAFLKVKFAARQFTWIKFIIVKREKNQWVETVIKP